MNAFILTLLLGGAMSAAAAADTKALAPAELQAFRGTFDLDDGKSLTVSQRGRKLFAQINNGPEFELVASGAKTFRAASGQPRLEFKQYPNGTVTGVRLIRASK
jgi:hypothetical protein